MIISVLCIFILSLLSCYFFQNSCSFCKKVTDLTVNKTLDLLLGPEPVAPSVVKNSEPVKAVKVATKKTVKKSAKKVTKNNKKKK